MNFRHLISINGNMCSDFLDLHMTYILQLYATLLYSALPYLYSTNISQCTKYNSAFNSIKMALSNPRPYVVMLKKSFV